MALSFVAGRTFVALSFDGIGVGWLRVPLVVDVFTTVWSWEHGSVSSFKINEMDSLFICPVSFSRFLATAKRRKLLEAGQGDDPAGPLPRTFCGELIRTFEDCVLINKVLRTITACARAKSCHCDDSVIDRVVRNCRSSFTGCKTGTGPLLLHRALVDMTRRTKTGFICDEMRKRCHSTRMGITLRVLGSTKLVVPACRASTGKMPLKTRVGRQIIGCLVRSANILLNVLKVSSSVSSDVGRVVITSSVGLISGKRITRVVTNLRLVGCSSPRGHRRLCC